MQAFPRSMVPVLLLAAVALQGCETTVHVRTHGDERNTPWQTRPRPDAGGDQAPARNDVPKPRPASGGPAGPSGWLIIGKHDNRNGHPDSMGVKEFDCKQEYEGQCCIIRYSIWAEKLADGESLVVTARRDGRRPESQSVRVTEDLVETWDLIIPGCEGHVRLEVTVQERAGGTPGIQSTFWVFFAGHGCGPCQ